MPAFRQAADGASGNAESQVETTADGSNTHGVVNRHPGCGISDGGKSSQTASGNPIWPYKIGVAEDRNKHWRRTMEDSHSFVYDFGGVHGQGFFSIFDGHAGKHAAEWCGANFHDYLLKAVAANGKQPVPDLLNTTFHNVDAQLSQMGQDTGTSSGCTAVTCFLRLEDEDGKAIAHSETGGVNPRTAKQGATSHTANNGQASSIAVPGASAAPSAPVDSSSNGPLQSSVPEDQLPSSQAPSQKTSSPDLSSSASSTGSQRGHSHSGSKSGNLFSSFAKRIRKASGGSTSQDSDEQEGGGASSASSSPIKKGNKDLPDVASKTVAEDLVKVPQSSKVRRVLYTANVGDARAVLCRRGHAVRLTYDHKASDAQEAKRITDAGGFVMNNRVNAVLAVTRSLGDSAMKEFVVGAPYTTETNLSDEDTFLIVACDGLWDVVEDQDAVDLVREVIDPQEAANRLLNHALRNYSTDNTSVMVIRFNIDGDAYCASAAANKRASPPPSSKVISSQYSSTASVDGQNTKAQGATTNESGTPATTAQEAAPSSSSSVASSTTSNSAQAGTGSTARASSTQDPSTAAPKVTQVRSNESNASTVSNAGSDLS